MAHEELLLEAGRLSKSMHRVCSVIALRSSFERSMTATAAPFAANDTAINACDFSGHPSRTIASTLEKLWTKVTTFGDAAMKCTAGCRLSPGCS